MRPSAIKVWFLFLTISERISSRVSEHSFCRDTNISRSIDCILETIRLTTPEGEKKPTCTHLPVPSTTQSFQGPRRRWRHEAPLRKAEAAASDGLPALGSDHVDPQLCWAHVASSRVNTWNQPGLAGPTSHSVVHGGEAGGNKAGAQVGPQV